VYAYLESRLDIHVCVFHTPFPNGLHTHCNTLLTILVGEIGAKYRSHTANLLHSLGVKGKREQAVKKHFPDLLRKRSHFDTRYHKLPHQRREESLMMIRRVAGLN
jgi:hypothetical protein